MATNPVDPVIAPSAPTIQAHPESHQRPHRPGTSTFNFSGDRTPRATMTRFSPSHQYHYKGLIQIGPAPFNYFFLQSPSDRLEIPALVVSASLASGSNSTWFSQLNSPSHNGDSFHGPAHWRPTGHHRLRLGAGRRFSALGTDCSLCRLQRGPWGPPVSDHHGADCVSTSHSPTISGPGQDHQPGSMRWIGVGVSSDHMP